MKSIACFVILYFVVNFRLCVGQYDDENEEVKHEDEEKDEDGDNGNNAEIQEDGTANKTLPKHSGDSEVARNIPLVPHQLSDSADSFTLGSTEYIVVSAKLKYSQVKLICQETYSGILAVVKDRKTAEFLSEALAETNLDLDSLWIGGQNKSINNSYGWYWTSLGSLDPIDSELYNSIKTVNDDITNMNRSCLAFGRSTHRMPQFRPLHCSVLRSFICQRKRLGPAGEGNSTHTGWIKAGKRKYKIFFDSVIWETALTRCARHDVNAVLAVIPNYTVSQLLGRYLLIGRPSLENAWIGARYDNEIGAYRFDSEPTPLSNATDNNNYPPWRTKSISRTKGCVLLDRHLTNTTLFAEARCERLRSYICSVESTAAEDIEHFVDFFFDHYGYRLFFDIRSWDEAKETCERYSDYKGRLVEVEEPVQLVHLLFIMGENRTDIRHLWLGGEYDGVQWIWESSKTPVDKTILNFVHNKTFTEEAELMNTCLNMDRENHLVSLHYGTECSWRQHFICEFPGGQLKKLKEEEAALAISD
ncbi:hypothetical protein RI129_003965 [Pyrocoelia pectoralis]|uniref:C-type lectin domain-containing protein n=1 Tax=Pyrocoelia pectoralis TaxID=417401 RepID=A0AAN7ZVP0_9COLE